jgi:hypothetical protein
MGIVLSVIDFLVLLTIVISASRWVWKQPAQGFGPLLLSICITLALLIFATVSFTAGSGLAAGSSLSQGILLIFLIAIAIVTRMSWANNPAE